MNERQRDLFLWLWSRRRAPGQSAIALRGALIGILGGVVFAGVMAGSIDTGGGKGLASLLVWIERGGALLALSVGAFGFIGWMGANRVFSAQEAMYQSMLASGAHVPAQKPDMQLADRGPALAVAIAVAVIIVFIVFVFFALG